MKYFTAKLWCELAHANKDIQREAERKWHENSKKYGYYFETIKSHLPKYILLALEKTYGFHDYIIDEITLKQNTQKGYVCYLSISNNYKRFQLEMTGITGIKIDIATFKHCILGKLLWGYHEFELIGPRTLRLSILCDIENEMFFEFKKIKLRETSL